MKKKKLHPLVRLVDPAKWVKALQESDGIPSNEAPELGPLGTARYEITKNMHKYSRMIQRNDGLAWQWYQNRNKEALKKHGAKPQTTNIYAVLHPNQRMYGYGLRRVTRYQTQAIHDVIQWGKLIEQHERLTNNKVIWTGQQMKLDVGKSYVAVIRASFEGVNPYVRLDKAYIIADMLGISLGDLMQGKDAMYYERIKAVRDRDRI